eukprot:TRINITY_DN1153_c0_g2_i1.p1 TRINITY_DN1153_c0_g2~~TRINITY_DN1153_c0_g2_i1.p1  ORF type:complete len:153 (-),score=7.36 TRINITY_DN1153_c0_g2_i1:400-858(-)
MQDPFFQLGFSTTQSILYFFCLPVAVLLHVLVLLQNFFSSDSAAISIFFWKLHVPVATCIFNSFLYGAFLAGILMFVLYRRQQLEIYDLNDQLRRTRLYQQELQNKLTKLQNAAGQILVSCPLSQMVDKGLDNFITENYRPGMLQAQRRKQE